MESQEFGSPYDALYAKSPSNQLWGDVPGRLVARISEFCKKGRVLDAGCGDGKNAIYLERHGYSVTGFDSSELALFGLHRRFAAAGDTPHGDYAVIDLHLGLDQQYSDYDVIVSYGLYHCLDPRTRRAAHRELCRRLRRGGILLFTCLTDALPLPPDHKTPGITLATRDELEEVTNGLATLESTHGTVAEHHLPLVGWHTHSAIWIVAKHV